MKEKIKIFKSAEEAKNLDADLVGSLRIQDGNDPLERILYMFMGKFTPTQRLNKVIKNEGEIIGADYAVVIDKYNTIFNNSGYLQNMEDCDQLLSLNVKFYKEKINNQKIMGEL